MDPTICVAGNLTADVELRFTQTGTAVASFTVAATPRTFDKAANGWKDGETVFLRVAAWRALAENAAESLRKGARVIVTGRLRQSSWTAEDGSTRTAIEVDAEEVGPSLRWATTTITRATRATAGPPGATGPGGGESSPWDVGPGPAGAPAGRGTGQGAGPGLRAVRGRDDGPPPF
jgi:single-strand DNA-binding protein